jgi:hypothetical protein
MISFNGTADQEDGRYDPPSDSTFQRVLNQADAAAIARMIGQWLAQQEISALAQLAVDGKVLCSSGRHDGKRHGHGRHCPKGGAHHQYCDKLITLHNAAIISGWRLAA